MTSRTIIRDRIRELRRVPASELLPNPRNWRLHPASQREALEGVLFEVGFADALLARELPDGRLELVDGHLRAETAPDQLVPVLVLDVDEAEANKILLTLDPLAAMADTNQEQLDALLREVETDSAAVEAMLAELADDAAATLSSVARCDRPAARRTGPRAV
jgi:ParB-like chromosome segregation protein Spo0J